MYSLPPLRERVQERADRGGYRYNGAEVLRHSIASAFEMPLADAPCVNCGQCIVACPDGALKEKDNTKEVFGTRSRIRIKYVVVQTRTCCSRSSGRGASAMPIGTPVDGKNGGGS